MVFKRYKCRPTCNLLSVHTRFSVVGVQEDADVALDSGEGSHLVLAVPHSRRLLPQPLPEITMMV